MFLEPWNMLKKLLKTLKSHGIPKEGQEKKALHFNLCTFDICL